MQTSKDALRFKTELKTNFRTFLSNEWTLLKSVCEINRKDNFIYIHFYPTVDGFESLNLLKENTNNWYDNENQPVKSECFISFQVDDFYFLQEKVTIEDFQYIFTNKSKDILDNITVVMKVIY